MAVNTAPTFSPLRANGKLLIPVGTDQDSAQAVVVLPDGRLWLAGQHNISATFGSADFALVRLTVSGALDTSFNPTGTAPGKLLLDVTGRNDTVSSAVLQSDGKLVVLGTSNNAGNLDMSIVRLNADGSLDTSFNPSGAKPGSLLLAVGGGADRGTSLALQADGSLVLAGTVDVGSSIITSNFSVVRLSATGTLDTGFNAAGAAPGKLVLPFVGTTAKVLVLADGKLLLAGSTGNQDFATVRVNADGTLDTSYNSTGQVIVPVGTGSDRCASAALQADGKVVLVGTSVNGINNFDISVVRLNADGSLDTSFNGTGKLIFGTGSGNDSASSIIVQSDGKLVITGTVGAGSVSNAIFVARLNTDGSLDTSFNATGLVTQQVGPFRNAGNSVIQQADGKLVVVGESFGTNGDIAVIRLNADGSLDTTFGLFPLATLGGSVRYNEGDPPIALDIEVGIGDVDLAALTSLDGRAGNYAGASVTLARTTGANADDAFSARGNLVFTGTGDVVLSGIAVGTFTNGAGTLAITFNGNASQARVDEVLSSIAYANTSKAPPRNLDIGWSFNDGNVTAQGTGGAKTGTGTSRVEIFNVNDAPVNSVPSAVQTTLEDTPIVFNAANGNLISTSDPDAGGASIRVTLTATQGVLTLSGTTGLSFDSGTTNGSASIVVSGSQANLNTALNGLSFAPAPGYVGSASVQIKTEDLGRSGGSGSLNQIDTDTVNVQVNAPTAVVTSVTASSPNGSYKLGDVIDITVSFNTAVIVAGGVPSLLLETGATDRSASYLSGSGSNALTFRYTVQAGDISADLDYASAGALALNGATLQNRNLVNATLGLSAPGAAGSLGANQALVIDGIAPTVSIASNVAAVKIGETAAITFTFSEDPGVSFTAADITTTGGTLGALGGAGLTRTATFTPAANTTANASITVGAASYTDAAGNTGAAGATPALAIDTLAPTVSITSNVAAVKVGETATITFTFSEDPGGSFTAADITTTGGTLGAITGAGLTRTATFTPPVNTTANASITVANASYTDSAGNTGNAGAIPVLAVDTVRPTATVVVADTSLTVGETSGVTITFSEAVTGLTTADLAVGNGIVSALATADGGITWTATLTPSANTVAATNSITLDNTGIADLAGNTGTATTASNTYAAETSRPAFASAAASGTILVMNYTDASNLNAVNIPAVGAFAVTTGGAANAVTAVAVNAAAKTVTLTLTTAITFGQFITVAYTDPTAGDDANAIQDTAGNDAATLSATAATNNAAAPPAPAEVPNLDADGDGVPTAQENLVRPLAPAGLTGDGNGDGALDSGQLNVTSAPFPGNPSRFVTVVADANKGITDTDPGQAVITNFKFEAPPANLPSGATLANPISFSAVIGGTGQTETFSIFVDANTNPNGYWVQNKQGIWNNIATGIEQVGDKIRIDFAITDGGPFDADGMPNGSIAVTGGAGNMPLTIIGQPPDLSPGTFWF